MCAPMLARVLQLQDQIASARPVVTHWGNPPLSVVDRPRLITGCGRIRGMSCRTDLVRLTTSAKATVVRCSFSEGGSPDPTTASFLDLRQLLRFVRCLPST